MNQRSTILALSTALLTLSGCATTVRFRALHGSGLDMEGARHVKIGRLTMQGRPSTPIHGFSDIFADMLASLFDERRDSTRNHWIREDLAARIERTGTLRTVEGDSFDVVLGCSYSFRLSDDETQGIVTDGKSRVRITRTALARIAFEVSRKDGRILANDSVRGYAQTTSEGPSASSAGDALLNWNEHGLRESVKSAHAALAQAFAPHWTIEYRELATGDDKAIKSANKLAAKERWDEAATVWRRSLAGSPKDRVASLRNLAVHHERRGDLDSALTLYEQAKAMDPSRSYDDEIERVGRWMGSVRRLDGSDSARLAPTSLRRK